MRTAALDIGGAHIKGAVHGGAAFTLPFQLWRRPDELSHMLADLAGERLGGVDRLAVTMTGELCDCFETKADGVRHILGALETAARTRLPDAELLVWTLDSRLVSLAEARRHPLAVAAANWLALAHFAARLRPTGRGILADMGSTTTDIVLLRDGSPQPHRYTDTERLLSGELVYTGSRRTPVSALVRELPYRGRSCPVCAELFATVLDAGLAAGLVRDDPVDHDTADGREATAGRARDRLARLVGADRTTFSAADAAAAAGAILTAQQALLAAALRRVAGGGGDIEYAVVSGSGESFIERACAGVARQTIRLSSILDAGASTAAPAVALATLAHERRDAETRE